MDEFLCCILNTFTRHKIQPPKRHTNFPEKEKCVRVRDMFRNPNRINRTQSRVTEARCGKSSTYILCIGAELFDVYTSSQEWSPAVFNYFSTFSFASPSYTELLNNFSPALSAKCAQGKYYFASKITLYQCSLNSEQTWWCYIDSILYAPTKIAL